MAPARKALTMNGNDHICWKSLMRFQDQAGAAVSASSMAAPRGAVPVAVECGRFRLADHDEPPVGGPQHLDRRAVEPGQRLRGDDLARGAGGGTALGEVHDAVEVVEYRVDVVGDH